MLPEPFRAMDPDDEVGWHAAADWLEEYDSPPRAELVRLTRLLRNGPLVPNHERHEGRLRELLAAGVEPCVATLTNRIGMEFVYVPPGVFLMGSPKDEEGRAEDEGPMHEVEITRGFWLGRYPVTQAEYEGVMGENPSHFSARGEGKAAVGGMDTGRLPVEMVSFRDARKFCKGLKGNEDGKGRAYRLPTEAEWEYACRGAAGSTAFCFGPSLSSLQANINGTQPYGGGVEGPFLGRTSEVGQYRPNGFGLHDMHGNVWEWCADWCDQTYYANSPRRDPVGPSRGSYRIFRGGSWHREGWGCRSAFRSMDPPTNRADSVGFRVVLVPPGE